MDEQANTSVLSALIVGAGPAGLMAADRLARAGIRVTIAEAKPSAGRKFLMAGKSGLNLTKAEGDADFARGYVEGAAWLAPMLKDFGPDAVQDWARGLGQSVFIGSTGRVFPDAMKASPLLRAWMAHLDGLGVRLRTRHRCIGWDGNRGANGNALRFETPDGPQILRADVIVLALGGSSWARLGSDGQWANWVEGPLTPFAPSNVGVTVDWSPHMSAHLGAPIKGAALQAGKMHSRGEFTLSAMGLEGGGLYALTPALRQRALLTLDLFPDLGTEELTARLSRPRGKASMTTHLRKTVKLDGVRRALVQEWLRPLPAAPADLAHALKAIPVPLTGLRPLDEAISTAGGLTQAGLTDHLMLRDRPGVFAAGEMLDWDALTGGYLITGCLATGRWAGDHAAAYALGQAPTR